jgi:hypothetical protein
MADSSFRSFRRDSPARENEPSQRDGLSDPLAELARLIGQRSEQGDGQPPVPEGDAAPASEFDWASVNENGGYGANRPGDDYGDRSAEPAAWPLDEGYESEQSAPPPNFPAAASFNGVRREPDQNARSYDPRNGQPPAQSRTQPFPFMPAAHDSYQAENREQHGAYAQSHSEDYADDDYDDEADPPRRGGTVVVVALLGLAVLGTAGALGYRAIIGGSVIPGLPPIIKPIDGPIKVKPDQQAQGANPSQANSARGTGEQVVTNQEQPVDVQATNQVPRMIKTIPVLPSGSPDPGVAGGQPPANVAQVPVAAPGYAEPVPPAQPFRADRAAASQAPAVNRQIPTPTTRSGPAPGSAPTASVTRPKPQTKPVRTATPDSQSAGGPLSLVPPQEGATPQAPPPRAVHTAANNPAAPVALGPSGREEAAHGAGTGYVQVSSQRSEAEAQSAYRALQTQFPQQLGSRHAVFRRADLGDKGIYYRALVGPFATAEQASSFCSSLKAAGGSCFMQRD